MKSSIYQKYNFKTFVILFLLAGSIFCTSFQAFAKGAGSNSHDVKSYAKPVKKLLVLKINPDEISTIQVVDLFGRNILAVQLIDTEIAELYVGHLQAGVYYVKVSVDNELVQTQRLVKVD